jgi:hypothetical protein
MLEPRELQSGQPDYCVAAEGGRDQVTAVRAATLIVAFSTPARVT